MQTMKVTQNEFDLRLASSSQVFSGPVRVPLKHFASRVVNHHVPLVIFLGPFLLNLSRHLADVLLPFLLSPLDTQFVD